MTVTDKMLEAGLQAEAEYQGYATWQEQLADMFGLLDGTDVQQHLAERRLFLQAAEDARL